jgi:hypothetical protein
MDRNIAALSRSVSFASPIGVATLIAGWLLLSSPMADAADSLLSFHGPASADDLVCPSVAVAPARPSESAEAAQMPTPEELGSLARPVVRRPPDIDPSTISGFAVRDASGPRSRRIAIWGDSHVAAGAFMPTLLDSLQSRGVTVATRYLPPTMGRANVRLPSLRAFCIGSSWTAELAYSARDRLRVGPALVNRVSEAGAGSYLWLDLRNADRRPILRELQIVYRAPEGATLAVSVNDGPEQLATLGRDPESQTLTVRADGLISTLRLRVSQGRIVLHGFILDYARPPLVTFDVFGVPSATAQGWVNLDPGYLKESLRGGDYDAVMLEYGTNEGAIPHFDRDRYAAGLKDALENMRRVFPHAACLLVGPPDRGVLVRPGEHRPDILSNSRTVGLIEAAQVQVGAPFGCAQWNWQVLMGGEGGSYGWASNGPPLMGRDLTHLTASGYRLTGDALARSLGF